jgi:hypothetical protein
MANLLCATRFFSVLPGKRKNQPNNLEATCSVIKMTIKTAPAKQIQRFQVATPQVPIKHVP